MCADPRIDNGSLYLVSRNSLLELSYATRRVEKGRTQDRGERYPSQLKVTPKEARNSAIVEVSPPLSFFASSLKKATQQKQSKSQTHHPRHQNAIDIQHRNYPRSLGSNL